MVNLWTILHNSILNDINFGSNVNIAINKPIRILLLAGAIAVTGCATRPRPVAVNVPPYQVMDSFKADCLYAKSQIEFLERKLVEYQQYHESYPYTDADTRYYRQVKNALWALRTSCIVK